MKSKVSLNLISVFVMAVVLTTAAIALPGWVRAQGGGVGAQTAVGTAFTYQGRLLYNSTAISGTCSLSFKLYDAASGGNQVGTGAVTDGSVSVSDGFFSVELDFGGSAFTGEARWLEVVINSCPGGASNATLSPRVALNPAPYALSLRPGAVISGAVSGDSGLKVVNSNTGGAAYGVYGESMSPSGYGLYSKGNAHVEGQLTWKTITSYLSIPAAAFNPTGDGETFNQSGYFLNPGTSGTPETNYVALVELPHSATVTKFTFYWSDASGGGNGNATLYRINLAGSESYMAITYTSGSSGVASSSADTSISLSSVDNSQYGYYIWLSLPDSNITAYGVVIEYTIDRPY